jgi:hypothetical protein
MQFRHYTNGMVPAMSRLTRKDRPFTGGPGFRAASRRGVDEFPVAGVPSGDAQLNRMGRQSPDAGAPSTMIQTRSLFALTVPVPRIVDLGEVL